MKNPLQVITRELILSQLEDLRVKIETRENNFENIEENFKQMEALEIDILKGNKARLEQTLINNSFEEIN